MSSRRRISGIAAISALALILLQPGCASPRDGAPGKGPRYRPPQLALPGASYLYEGTLTRRMTVRRGGVEISEVRNTWKLTLRDFVLAHSDEVGTRIATHARIEAKEGGEEIFEGLNFGLHKAAGGLVALGVQRAFHPAMALIHFPRQAWLTDEVPPEGKAWTARDRLKLSNQGTLETDFHWKARRPAPGEADPLVHLHREWKRAPGEGRGHARTGSFSSDFWIDPVEGTLARYRRSWVVGWGGRLGSADVEEELEAEIRLVGKAPPPPEGTEGIAAEAGKIQAILEGFGATPGLREATTRRIEEFRREFPDSPLAGTLGPIETAITRLEAAEKIGSSDKE